VFSVYVFCVFQSFHSVMSALYLFTWCLVDFPSSEGEAQRQLDCGGVRTSKFPWCLSFIIFNSNTASPVNNNNNNNNNNNIWDNVYGAVIMTQVISFGLSDEFRPLICVCPLQLWRHITDFYFLYSDSVLHAHSSCALITIIQAGKNLFRTSQGRRVAYWCCRWVGLQCRCVVPSASRINRRYSFSPLVCNCLQL